MRNSIAVSIVLPATISFLTLITSNGAPPMSNPLSRRNNSSEKLVRSRLTSREFLEDVDANDYIGIMATLKNRTLSIREKVVSEFFPVILRTISSAEIPEREWLLKKLDRCHRDFGENLAQLFFDYVCSLEHKKQTQFLTTINKQSEHFLKLLQNKNF